MGLSRKKKEDLEHLALLKLVSVCIQLNLYVYLGFKHTAIFPLCPVFFVSSLKIYTVQSFHPGIKKKNSSKNSFQLKITITFMPVMRLCKLLITAVHDALRVYIVQLMCERSA